jgi:multiple sugar transport system permease protein/raffinose/stachyose/melibiose transport system permease protein
VAMKNKKFLWIVLIPIFAHMTIFLLIPIIGGGVISFMDYNPLRDENLFIGLDNYVRTAGNDVFWIALINTLVFVACTVAINIALSLGLATLISQLKSNKTRSFFRMMVFMPCVAPLVATSVVWGRSIYPTTNGLINLIIKACGGDTINWIGSADYLMISVIVFTLWADIGYNTILFSAGIDGIPGELYEAADLDGAKGWKKFRRITLPLLKRMSTFVLLMTLISHFQMFAQFDVIAYQGGPQNSGLVLTSYIYQMAFRNKEMGQAAAISMALFVIILLVSLVQQRISRVDWEY